MCVPLILRLVSHYWVRCALILLIHGPLIAFYVWWPGWETVHWGVHISISSTRGSKGKLLHKGWHLFFLALSFFVRAISGSFIDDININICYLLVLALARRLQCADSTASWLNTLPHKFLSVMELLSSLFNHHLSCNSLIHDSEFLVWVIGLILGSFDLRWFFRLWALTGLVLIQFIIVLSLGR